MSDAPPIVYPVKELEALVDSAQIARYFERVFHGITWTPQRGLCIRGIGEKGTPREGFRDNRIISPLEPGALDFLVGTAKRFAAWHTAFFCVPAALKSHERAGSDDVELFSSVVVDLDSGNTNEKLQFLRQHIGEASLVVGSGGNTAEGTPKLHVYYILNEATDQVPLIVSLRDTIARRAGGDHQFGMGVASNPYGRAHQPIRVAGSVHAKNGVVSRCTILSDTNCLYDLADLAEKINGMPCGPWFVPSEQPELQKTVSGFSPTSGVERETQPLNAPVYAGSDGERTRWNEFNRVAGHYIHCARRGELSIDEARESVAGWMAVNMVPPWPADRFQKEFAALVAVDLRRNPTVESIPAVKNVTPLGVPIPKPENVPVVFASHPGVRQAIQDASGEAGIHGFTADRWMSGEVPKHAYIVDKLIVQGEATLFVSEGGAGKTSLLLDLGRKIAAYDGKRELDWCGQKICKGGTVVMFLNEDSPNEIHIRGRQMDEEGLIPSAGNRLIVVPMTALGGAFDLVKQDKITGAMVTTPEWECWLKWLRQIPDLTLVCFDTLSSVFHGDENNPTVIKQFMRELNRISGELGATALCTHHVRKGSSQNPIRNMEDLRDAVRGSSGIVNGFRVVFGMFKLMDYHRRMRAMNLSPERNALWKFGICKSNIGGLITVEKTLHRKQHGLLADVSEQDRFNHINTSAVHAWLIFAVSMAAKDGHPFQTGKETTNGLYRRRSILPNFMRKMGSTELSRYVEDCLQEGRLVVCAHGGKNKQWLDVPDGPIATDSVDWQMLPGAYLNPPVWDNFDFDKEEGIIKPKADMVRPFQALGRGNADQEAPPASYDDRGRPDYRTYAEATAGHYD